MSQQNSKEELERAIRRYVNDTGDGLTNIYKVLDKQIKATKKLSASDRIDAIVEIIQAIFDTAAPAFNEMSADMFRQLTGFTTPELLVENKTLAEREIENVVRGIVSNSINTSNDVPVRELWGFVHKNLRSGGRDMIVRASERHGKRFARVPRGKTCAWCTMIASQGFVYYSQETAGRMTKFHDHCDCDIIPESQADLVKAMGFDFDEARKQYQAAEKARRADPDGKKREADYYMRRLFPDAYTDGVEKKVLPKLAGFKNDTRKKGIYNGNPVPKGHREILEGTRKDWEKRLKALKSNYMPAVEAGDEITLLEILSVERLERAGYTVEWIPRNRGRKQTSDFIMKLPEMEKADVVEIKTIGSNPRNIREKINKGKNGSGKNLKPHYLIDIGTEPLSSKIRNSLEKYNFNNPGLAVKMC